MGRSTRCFLVPVQFPLKPTCPEQVRVSQVQEEGQSEALCWCSQRTGVLLQDGVGFPIHERAGRRRKTGVLEPRDNAPWDRSPRTRPAVSTADSPGPAVSTADSSGPAVGTADSSRHRPTAAPPRHRTPRHRQPPASCAPPQGMPLPSLWVPFHIPATKPAPRAPQHARRFRPSHLRVPPHPAASLSAASAQAVCCRCCPTARTQPWAHCPCTAPPRICHQPSGCSTAYAQPASSSHARFCVPLHIYVPAPLHVYPMPHGMLIITPHNTHTLVPHYMGICTLCKYPIAHTRPCVL